MSTCLDDINVTLQEIRDTIGAAGGWESFSPTLSQGVSLTFNTHVAVWRIAPGFDWYQARIVLFVTSGGTNGEVVRIGNLPFNAFALQQRTSIGGLAYWDSSEGRMYITESFPSGSSEISGWGSYPDGILGTNPGFAAGSGDVISVNLDIWLF